MYHHGLQENGETRDLAIIQVTSDFLPPSLSGKSGRCQRSGWRGILRSFKARTQILLAHLPLANAIHLNSPCAHAGCISWTQKLTASNLIFYYLRREKCHLAQPSDQLVLYSRFNPPFFNMTRLAVRQSHSMQFHFVMSCSFIGVLLILIF